MRPYGLSPSIWVSAALGIGPLDFHTWYKYIVNRGKCYFLVFFAIFRSFFPLPPPPGRGLIVLFFGLFCYFSVFSVALPPSGNFSADALESEVCLHLPHSATHVLRSSIRLTSYSYFATMKIRLTFNLKLYGNFCTSWLNRNRLAYEYHG